MSARPDMGARMGKKVNSVMRTGEGPNSNNEQVLQEMQDFLRALESYPARFASDPTITFEQHRSKRDARHHGENGGG